MNLDRKILSGIIKEAVRATRPRGLTVGYRLYKFTPTLSDVVSDEEVNEIIGTLEISLARQFANAKRDYIILDKANLSELEESLRIGANITPIEAKKILDKVENIIKQQEEKKVKFLDEGIFEVDGETLKFKLGE